MTLLAQFVQSFQAFSATLSNNHCSLCRWVDEVVKDAPWVLDLEFINKHKIDYVTHDALPYSDASGQANDVYDFVSFNADIDGKLYHSLARWLRLFLATLMKQCTGQKARQIQGNTAH